MYYWYDGPEERTGNGKPLFNSSFCFCFSIPLASSYVDALHTVIGATAIIEATATPSYWRMETDIMWMV
jgi:hypothetical protein